MDYLNSIWNILTKENEILTRILTAPTVIIEALLVFRLITFLFKIQYSTRQKVIYVFLFSFANLATEAIIPSPFNVFVNYLILFIITKFVLKTSHTKTILAIITPSIAFALAGTLILKPILEIFELNIEEITNIPLYRFIYLSSLYLIVFIVTILIKFFNARKVLLDDLKIENKKIIYLNIILGFITLSIELTITVFYTDALPSYINFLNFISLIVYFFISFTSLTRAMKLQITTNELINAENYNNTLSILYDNVKAFKHDFDNMVFTIGGFVNTNDIEGLKLYYTSLEKECQKTNNIAMLNPILINNPGIYNLLTVKYQKAVKCNIDIELEFFFDLNKLHMPIYDFSRIIGILIDNGIEAASETDAKLVKITFHDSPASHIQIFTIENSYNNKDVDKNKIFEKGITGKENHSGMGLWEVSQILNRNNNSKLITEPSELLFKQRLEIYY